MPNFPQDPERRRRRNADARHPVHATSGGAKSKPPPAPPGLHPEALAWYLSLAESGQSQFYQASD